MSTLNQPLLIANVNYHVGHWVAIYVAEEQGFFKEEGLMRYEYERGGLLPGPSESQTLGLAIREHGVDIATAVDTESAISQRFQGADVYIVGGWRYTPFLKWYGSKHITDISKLRGGKIGVRERSADGGGLVEFFIEEALKKAGVNPATEVEQVQDPVFGYRNNPAHIEMLRSGKVNAITSSPPFSDQLEKEGYPVILDPNKVFPRRPGKVTVAPRRTIDQRGEEMKAYFRAIIRTFWFMRDVKNFEYLHALETRLRKLTHNEDEQRLFIASAPDRVHSWALPMDGGIERQALGRILQEMVKRGRLERTLPVEEVFRDEAVRDAYREVSNRATLKHAFDTAMAAVEKYGF
jgi:ABC-type nitrate/sulfonate/bicarbonate transport system substrate-binding protein